MNCLITGSSGFIGSNLIKRLKQDGHYVVGVDIKKPRFARPDEFLLGDLRNPAVWEKLFSHPQISFDRLYALAAWMGGAGVIFTGDNDSEILHDNALININTAHYATINKVKQVFYSSSACVYPPIDELTAQLTNYDYKETDAYPAMPDNEYGWEKLFSEHLYLSYNKNKGLNVRLARFHNTFGPYCAWKGGREKAPAAICRKVIEADNEIEMWGDGEQTRSFLYIDECLDGVEKLMQSDFVGTVNIGSSELISINQLAEWAMEFKGRKLKINHIDGPVGIRGRNSDNTLIEQKLGWKPSRPTKEGLLKLYKWIESQI